MSFNRCTYKNIVEDNSNVNNNDFIVVSPLPLQIWKDHSIYPTPNHVLQNAFSFPAPLPYTYVGPLFRVGDFAKTSNEVMNKLKRIGSSSIFDTSSTHPHGCEMSKRQRRCSIEEKAISLRIPTLPDILSVTSPEYIPPFSNETFEIKNLPLLTTVRNDISTPNAGIKDDDDDEEENKSRLKYLLFQDLTKIFCQEEENYAISVTKCETNSRNEVDRLDKHDGGKNNASNILPSKEEVQRLKESSAQLNPKNIGLVLRKLMKNSIGKELIRNEAISIWWKKVRECLPQLSSFACAIDALSSKSQQLPTVNRLTSRAKRQSGGTDLSSFHLPVEALKSLLRADRRAVQGSSLSRQDEIGERSLKIMVSEGMMSYASLMSCIDGCNHLSNGIAKSKGTLRNTRINSPTSSNSSDVSNDGGVLLLVSVSHHQKPELIIQELLAKASEPLSDLCQSIYCTADDDEARIELVSEKRFSELFPHYHFSSSSSSSSSFSSPLPPPPSSSSAPPPSSSAHPFTSRGSYFFAEGVFFEAQTASGGGRRCMRRERVGSGSRSNKEATHQRRGAETSEPKAEYSAAEAARQFCKDKGLRPVHMDLYNQFRPFHFPPLSHPPTKAPLSLPFCAGGPDLPSQTRPSRAPPSRRTRSSFSRPQPPSRSPRGLALRTAGHPIYLHCHNYCCEHLITIRDVVRHDESSTFLNSFLRKKEYPDSTASLPSSSSSSLFPIELWRSCTAAEVLKAASADSFLRVSSQGSNGVKIPGIYGSRVRQQRRCDICEGSEATLIVTKDPMMGAIRNSLICCLCFDALHLDDRGRRILPDVPVYEIKHWGLPPRS